MSLDVLTLNLAKKYSKSITSIGGTLGSIVRQPDGNLQITYNPTTGSPMVFNAGVVPPGKSIQSGSVDTDGNLTLTFDDGSTSLVTGSILGPRGLKGDTGDNGKPVIISADSNVDTGYIKWTYQGSSTWTNIVALSDLRGKQGDKISLRMSGTILEYQYEGDSTWIPIYDLANIEIPASILAYSTETIYRENDVFYDSVSKKVFHVVRNYMSVSLEVDEANGDIYSIGGQDITPLSLISSNVNNALVEGTDDKLFVDLSDYSKTDEIFQTITEAQLNAYIADPSSMPNGVRFAVVG